MAQTAKDKKLTELLKLFENDVDAAIEALRLESAKQKKKSAPKRKYGQTVVSLQEAKKTYKLGKQKVEALKGVSLEIKAGEFVALTGPSGSGKSTLLQLIGGLDKPTDGIVRVDEQDLKKLSDTQLSIFRNQTIGFVFQFFYLQPFLNVQTNLEVPAMFSRTKPTERAPKAAELAKSVGLEDRTKHLPKELSGGQMQRAAIARALLNKPKILLADEPTGNLDSTNGQAIIDLFEKVRTDFGTTVIVVTHDPKVAARADREIVLKDGVLVS